MAIHHDHYGPDHVHGPGPEGTTAFAASTMMLMLALILAVVLIAAVFAWSPWTNNVRTTTPGQGGSDNTPSQQVPAPQQQPAAPVQPNNSAPDTSPNVPSTVPNTVP